MGWDARVAARTSYVVGHRVTDDLPQMERLGAEDDSPPFHRGPQTAPLLRGLGWLNGGWRAIRFRVPGDGRAFR
jgi:hypothetical protein